MYIVVTWNRCPYSPVAVAAVTWNWRRVGMSPVVAVSPPWDVVVYISVVVHRNTDIGISSVGELFLHRVWLCSRRWLCQRRG
jgi:hypothetical protein